MTALSFRDALTKAEPGPVDVHIAGAGGKKKPVADEMSKGWSVQANIVKVDEEHRLAFGFFSVCEKNGELVVDSEDDRIAPDELEKAAYGHVLDARIASDGHERIGVGKLVESVVFTPEKTAAMVACLKEIGVKATIDIPAVAWWGGYYVHDDDVWEAVRSGEYVAFSIGGHSQRTPADGE